MGPGEHPPWQQFGLALCAVALATLVRLALDPWLGDQLPILIYFVSIAFAALYCDPPASLTALVAGAAASRFFFFRPRHTLALDGSMLLVMAAYLAAAPATSAVSDAGGSQYRAANAIETK